MTSFYLDNNSAKYQISAWGAGNIKINDLLYSNNLIISSYQLVTPWMISQPSEITYDSLKPALELKPQIILIGTGRNYVLLPLTNYGEIFNYGIGVEIMSTPAAARTFNALTAERRAVVAALLLP